MYKAKFPAIDEAVAVDQKPVSNHRRLSHHSEKPYSLAQIMQGGHECRDISMRGVDVDTSVQLNLNDRVVITLSSSTLNGRVVWLNGEDCGIAFDEPVDCFLNEATPNSAQARETVLVDMLIRGIDVANDRNFQPGLRVQVILEDGHEQDGLVRWSRDNIAGVILLEPLSRDDYGPAHRPGQPSARSS